MADIETIKAALRICLAGNPCAGCHYFKECYKENHTDILLEDTLKVIEALQAENRLITENNTEIDKQRGEIALRLESLRLENERLKAKRRWIPVSERMPDERINPLTHDFDTVICLCEFSKATDVRMYAFKDGHFYCGHMVMDEYITHWMYKPQPPKEGDGE